MKYAEEHKNMEALNVQDSLEKGIKMADKCSMMDEGMKPDIAPEVRVLKDFKSQKKNVTLTQHFFSGHVQYCHQGRKLYAPSSYAQKGKHG